MRRRRPEKRKIVPDPVYNDLIVAKFVNNLMKAGKKSVAEKIFYDSLSLIEKKEKSDNNALEVFKKALKNAAKSIKSTPFILLFFKILIITFFIF